jgi:3',5'-cyclic AMP phosphodiesterase CpdA
MTRPLVVVQLSDLHIGAEWGGPDPAQTLAEVVERVKVIGLRPDAVLVTGDLTEHAAAPEYEFVRDTVGGLGAPALVLPGNHDERGAIRAAFGLPGEGSEPVQHAAEVGGLRLLLLDTIVPGEEGGAFDVDRRGWLAEELSAAPATPTLIAMHHPPIAIGIPAFDEIGLPEADRRAFGDLVAAHPQVKRIVAGHIHRPIAGEVGGRSVLVAPSTYMQTRLDLEPAEIDETSDAPAFAAHLLIGDDLVSHVQPVSDGRP